MVRWNLFDENGHLVYYVWIDVPKDLTGKEQFVYCQGYLDAIKGAHALPKGTWYKEARA